MNSKDQASVVVQSANEYVAPVVRVMSESEVLSAFQVNAAGTMAWWTV